MKRLALVAAVFAVAACSQKAKPAADTGAAMAPAAAPAATDTSAAKTDTTKKDTTAMKMDTTKKDTSKKKI
jgi:hypothetical protein